MRRSSKTALHLAASGSCLVPGMLMALQNLLDTSYVCMCCHSRQLL